MSVNLKGRKNAKAEAVQAPSELVMAGGQTPWAGELPGGGAGNPFDGAGMPAVPPPPPSYAPGEEPPAEPESGGRKLPVSKPVIIAVAAIVVLGGGYWFLTKGGSDTPTAPPPHHVVGHPAVGAVKPPAKTGTGAKAGNIKVKPPTKAGVAKTSKGGKAAVVKKPGKTTAIIKPAVVYTAALPGEIGDWAKIAAPSAGVTTMLTEIRSNLTSNTTDVQSGAFGGTATKPYLLVVTGQAKVYAKNGAMLGAKNVALALRKGGFAVAAAVPVSHVPWGGTAACGTASSHDALWAYCVWQDHNTFGIIMAPGRTQANAPHILNMSRSAIEH